MTESKNHTDVSPNPIFELIQLCDKDLKKEGKIEVRDVNGKRIHHVVANDPVSQGVVNAKSLVNGTYILLVNYQNGFRTMNKILISR